MNAILHIIVQTKWNLDVTSSAYIDFAVENNDKDPKFEVDDENVWKRIYKILKYKNISAKCYAPN